MSNILLYVLFFSISLIHSSFLNYFGFEFNSLVNGNFEFTKIIFFNIFSSLTIISFLIEKFFKKEKIKIYYNKFLLAALLVSIISTIFSISSFISFFGNQEKAHSMIFVLNLVGIFIVLTNKKRSELIMILKIFLISFILVYIIGIKEYFYPSLNYQDSIDKAISTFGNNQFLALSIILLFPLILRKYKTKYSYISVALLLFLLILTKSFLGVTISTCYFIYHIFGKNKGLIFSSLFIFLLSIIIFNYFPEKLHSFISRFYIWQNTISLYMTSYINVIFGYGLETLELMFSKEKNPYLYIYENYGFIADRSHNIWIDILFSTGLIGFTLSLYASFQILNITKKTYYYDIFIIFFIFSFFNFAGISHYLFLILIFSLFLKKDNSKIEPIKIKTNYIIIIPILICIFINISFSKFYIAETYYKKGDITKAINRFNYPKYYFENGEFEIGLHYYEFPPIYYYQNKIIKENKNYIISNCNDLVKNYGIAENYIWCGDLLKKANYKKESHFFYLKGLSLLPDLWNKNSKYYDNFLIKNTISGNRFLSDKYGNLKPIIDSLK